MHIYLEEVEDTRQKNMHYTRVDEPNTTGSTCVQRWAREVDAVGREPETVRRQTTMQTAGARGERTSITSQATSV